MKPCEPGYGIQAGRANETLNLTPMPCGGARTEAGKSFMENRGSATRPMCPATKARIGARYRLLRSAVVTFSLNLTVEDCDALHRQAVAAGAEELRAPMTYPWGERRELARSNCRSTGTTWPRSVRMAFPGLSTSHTDTAWMGCTHRVPT